jgi:hypothetical protein
MLMAVALLAVSTSGPLIAAMAVPAMAIAFWRNAMAAAVLLPAVGLTRREELRGLDRRERRLALLAGVLLALHFATWIPSLFLTSVASATALVATQPVWAALIAGARGTPVGRQVWTGIAVAMTGALLLTGVDLRVSGEALVGDLLAVVGGMFAAAYMTCGQRGAPQRLDDDLHRALLLLDRPGAARRLRGVPAAADRLRHRRLGAPAGAHRRRAAARALAVQRRPAPGQPDAGEPVDPARDPGGGAHRGAVPRPDAAAAGGAGGGAAGVGDRAGHPRGQPGHRASGRFE